MRFPHWRPSPGVALAALLATAAAQYAWNVRSLDPYQGYDAYGHHGYVRTLAEEGRIPHPLAGWSSFHPPVYYLAAAGIWRLLLPLGQGAVDAGIRAINAVAILLLGAVVFRLLIGRGAPPAVALAAAALALFVPSAQLAAVMIGNEAFGALFAGLALSALVALQRDPRRLGPAAAAGILGGAALATKYTGLFTATACSVPFLRRGWDRPQARAAALCGLLLAGVAGPVYLRNLAITGTLLPMTAGREPMKSIEEAFVIRPRRVADYLWLDPASLLRPSVVVVRESDGAEQLNGIMTNVWGLFYASLWADPFAIRIPLREAKGLAWQRALLALGAAPTLLVGLGLGLSARDLLRQRRRGLSAEDAPAVAMAGVALLAFVAFTWRAPSLAAVKASYLLPLVAPAGLFFARGMSAIGPRARASALALSFAAAGAAALVFTQGAVLEGYR